MSIKFILNLLIATFLSLSFCQAQDKEEIYIPEQVSIPDYLLEEYRLQYLLYNTACYYSLAEEADSAFYYLDLSIKEGFSSYRDLKEDKDFINLHEDNRWHKIIKKLGDEIYKKTQERIIIDDPELFYINKNDTITAYEFYENRWEMSIITREEIIERFAYTEKDYKLSEIDFNETKNTLAHERIQTEDYILQFTKDKVLIYEDKSWELFKFQPTDIFGLKAYVIPYIEDNRDEDIEINFLIFKLKNGKYCLIEGSAEEVKAVKVDNSEAICVSHINPGYLDTERHGFLCTKNNKWGLKKEGKYIFEPIYDSLFVDDFTIAYYQNQTLIYNKDGKLLITNPKVFYYYSQNYMQIIDSLSHMYFMDTLGKQFDEPINIRTFMGSDTPEDSYQFRLNTKSNTHDFKQLYLHEYFRDRDEYEYDLDETTLETQLFKSKQKEYRKVKYVTSYIYDSRYDRRDESERYLDSYYDAKLIDRKYKKVTFINGEVELYYVPYWYEQGFYGGRLSYSYLIAQKRQKYGIMDFREDTVVIPFLYNKITSLEGGTYLILEKEGLKGIYPYFGTKVEFKEIEPFIEFYARFEDIYNRKGWIDRRGNRYYDN